MYSGKGATQQQELGYRPGGQGFLKPAEWNFRSPFFCRLTKDVTWISHPADAGPVWFNDPFDEQLLQESMDQEIEFAAQAGIDFFIFNGPTRTIAANGWELHNNLDAYLASPIRYKINFVHALYGPPGITQSRSKVDLMLDETIGLMQLPQWQKVRGGRPLVPVLWPVSGFGAMLDAQTDPNEKMSLAEFVAHIRQRVQAVGLADPYIVGEEVSHTYQKASVLEAAGFDAISDYAGGYGGAMTTRGAGPSYSQATQTLLSTYSTTFAGTIPLIPPMVNQLYPWPRASSATTWYYELPLPGDVAARINQVFDYVADNPTKCNARAVFMYSWNEHSEGGGLCPTMGASPDYTPVDDQLIEVGNALANYRSPSPLAGSPIGANTVATCAEISGFACDPSDFQQPLNVHVYDGGPYGIGTLVAAKTAGQTATTAAACGGVTAHGFAFPPPANLIDGKAHLIYVYAINIGAGQNVILDGAPRTLRCARQ